MKEQHHRPYHQPNPIKRDAEIVRSVMSEQPEQVPSLRPEGVLQVIGISTAPDSDSDQQATQENIMVAARRYLAKKR